MPRLLLAMLLVLVVTTATTAAPREYTITQLYTAGKRAPEIKGARSVTEHALIVTPSYRVEKGNVLHYYHHPQYGRQIRELLEKDTFVSWWEVDGFMRRHQGRIHHVSLYPEGFVLVQLDNPQQVLIIPVSLVTVRRSEEIVRAHLQLR